MLKKGTFGRLKKVWGVRALNARKVPKPMDALPKERT